MVTVHRLQGADLLVHEVTTIAARAESYASTVRATADPGIARTYADACAGLVEIAGRSHE